MKNEECKSRLRARALLLFFIFHLPFFAAGRAQALDPDSAKKEGRELALQMLALKPAEGSTNSGVFKIRDAKGKWTYIPARFRVAVTPTDWHSIYETAPTNQIAGATLTIIHRDAQPNEYCVSSKAGGDQSKLTGNETMVPFAGTDFWIADLGLEFLHWPQQRIVKKEMRRSQFCHVLESVNPKPAPGAYSRVVCWIDHDSLGIMQAEAYDAKNKLLKEFDPKDVQKVQGQWQVREMEIRNRQTGSKTQIEFDLDSE